MEEEKKKRPELIQRQTYEPLTNVATQQARADADAFYNELRQRYADVADPRRQAEYDAKVQRGRQFWTGANLFANVIANAINAHGTANGAPNMTYNDAATQKMYDVWRDADKQLRADRKDAQQRHDAIALQQNNMRLAAAQADDAAAQKAYDINFNNANADIADQNKLAQADWEYERKMDDALAQEERANKEWERRNAIQFQQNERLARIRHSGGGRSTKKSGDRSTKYDTKVGGMTIMSDNQTEKNYAMYSLANDMYDYYSSLPEEQKKKILGDDYDKVNELGKSQFAQRKFVEDYLEKFYDNDDNFRGYLIDNYGDVIDFGELPAEAVAEQSAAMGDAYLPLSANPYERAAAIGTRSQNDFDQFGGYSVRPENGVSLPTGRRYSASNGQPVRPFNTDRTESSNIPPYMRQQYIKK